MDLNLSASVENSKKPTPLWINYKTISYLNYYSQSSSKIIIFDLKSLLFRTKSCQNYRSDLNDWELKNPTTILQLKSFIMNDFRLVVFTNDKYFSSESQMTYDYLLDQLKLPLLILISKANDIFAKPCIGMWDFFISDLNCHIPINYSESKLILSSEGPNECQIREISYKFALNIGLEAIFLDQSLSQNLVKPRLSYSFQEIKIKGSVFKNEETQSCVSTDDLEVIIFVGPPGAGKSTFWKNHLSDYYWINCDKMRTKRKCLENMEKSLRNKKCCVIDNQNSTAILRQEYLKIAIQYSVKARCFVFLPQKEIALHLDKLRKINQTRKHLSGYVGEVAINKFYRDFEYPTLDEGFQEIKEIELIAGPFENSDDEKLFYTYT